ncbi:MAG: hypothetical protein A2Z04_06330 [Chloroflexi bacterium RBG_16_57_9]|nr:MAG: hypothetical protein A2Z04_06330 [Chloroflexi bacterium RBG_16_57_9]
MKLIVSIIHSDDAGDLVTALGQAGFQSTIISTTGGFLREGNATVLIGVADEKLEDVLEIIHQNCHARPRYINPLPPIVEPGELHLPQPVEVQVGGAIVFVINVERFERY